MMAAVDSGTTGTAGALDDSCTNSSVPQTALESIRKVSENKRGIMVIRE